MKPSGFGRHVHGGPRAVRRVTATIRDTREVWASIFLPQDRARVIELLAGLAKRVPDETARIDLAHSRPRFER